MKVWSKCQVSIQGIWPYSNTINNLCVVLLLREQVIKSYNGG